MGKNQKKKFNGIKCSLNETEGALSQAVAKEEAASKKVESWLDELSLEEREAEEEKQKKRLAQAKKEEEKARTARAQREEAEKQVERNARQWNVDKKKLLAPKGGVVQAELFEDKWYVQYEGEWMEVNDMYYCSLCDKHLNDCTLEAHVQSKAHANKVQWSGPNGATSNVTGDGCEEYDEPWFKFNNDEWGGYTQCLACDKRADEVHITSAGHLSRVEAWRESAQEKIQPVEEWLMYVFWTADASMEYDMGLKCLVCDKFCQDVLAHGSNLENASKEHKKRMSNYPYYRDGVRESRQRLITTDSTGILKKICDRQTQPLRGPDGVPAPQGRNARSNEAPPVRAGNPMSTVGPDGLERANATVFRKPQFQGRPTPPVQPSAPPAQPPRPPVQLPPDAELRQVNDHRLSTPRASRLRTFHVTTEYDGIETLHGVREEGYLELKLHETVTLQVEVFEDGEHHNSFSSYGFFEDIRGQRGWAPLACLSESVAQY